MANMACEQPKDPVIESVLETKSILTNTTWKLQNYHVSVANNDIPPPILINSNDELIESGNYDLDDILPSGISNPAYFMKFTDDNRILIDSLNTGVFVDIGSTFFIWNDQHIRLAPAGLEKLSYSYYYNSDDKTMSFTVTNEEASRAIDGFTDKFTKYVVNETPNTIGDAIAGIVFNSTALQNSINDFVVQAIAGKLDKLTDFDPEQAADSLAGMLMESLSSVDWQVVLSEAINEELQKFTSFDADALAAVISEEIAEDIQSAFTIDHIYNMLLPYMEGLATQDPETMADNIATLVVQGLFNVFDQENLQKIITPVWEQFTELNSDQVGEIADKFTNVVEDNWINTDVLTEVFLPFTNKISETPISQMGTLAQQMTESLKEAVNALNARFSDLNMAPDYEHIQSVIKGVLVAAKPLISINGPEEVASNIAQLIIDDFLNTENITGAFVSAINYFQAIDSQIAASTIAEWLVGLEGKVEPELIEWLSDKLSPMLQGFDPDYTAFKIAQKVNAFVDEHFTVENIQSKVLPLLQKVTNANTEALANLIASKIIDSDLVKEGITQENIAQILLPVLQGISTIDTTKVSQIIVDALVNSNVFKTLFTQERISKIIAFLLYKEAYNNFKIANNFREATITISHE